MQRLERLAPSLVDRSLSALVLVAGADAIKHARCYHNHRARLPVRLPYYKAVYGVDRSGAKVWSQGYGDSSCSWPGQ